MTSAEQDFFKRVLKSGIRMQHRFKPEPLLATTGVGYMASEGVTVMQKIKAGVARTQAKRANMALHTHL
jgi:hypothetical protein